MEVDFTSHNSVKKFKSGLCVEIITINGPFDSHDEKLCFSYNEKYIFQNIMSCCINGYWHVVQNIMVINEVISVE